MDAYQKYFFDVNGYLVIENALTSDELGALNKALDENAGRIQIRPAEQSLAAGSPALVAKHGRGDLSGMLMWPKPWCQPFRDLLLHDSTTPVLLELLRDAFRIDHVYGIITDEGAEGHVLHGGGTTDDLTHFYEFHHGKMRCGLTVVGWNLPDVNPGDGGFACIPGSHQAHYPTPPDVARLETDIGMVKQISAPAGSAVIFTEALTHGTLPWKGAQQRRSILYKYSPGPIASCERAVPADLGERVEEFTPQQQDLLRPPYSPRRFSLIEDTEG